MQVNYFLVPVTYLILGSHVIYDDSMNLRNILWLAPLPSDSPESWAAPGILFVHSNGKLDLLVWPVQAFLLGH